MLDSGQNFAYLHWQTSSQFFSSAAENAKYLIINHVFVLR